MGKDLDDSDIESSEDEEIKHGRFENNNILDLDLNDRTIKLN